MGSPNIQSDMLNQITNIYIHMIKIKKTYLLYVDANGLYGYSMADYMPQSDFKWLNADELKDFEINIHTYLNSTDIGYVLECDRYYPKSLLI